MPAERVIAPHLIEDLPRPVAEVLEDFVATLRHVSGPQLDSVILFGSAAEGRLRPTSDVNLLVVATGFTLPQLDAARLALQSGRAAAGLTVMFLEKAELAHAMEAFAVKFTDIKARHRVLYGESPLDSVAITRDAAIRRVRQVVLNLTLRLRERYVIDGAHEELLARILADATGPIRASAAALVALRDGRTLAPKEALAEIFPEASWRECLSGLSAVHRDEHLPPGATRHLFGEVLRLLAGLDMNAHSLT
ncbi:MAG TPA: nucleotidyltransferase domain-containing protein [Steroidobacteraceae bacterium]